MFWAKEINDVCTRKCWGSSRPFEMRILDSHKKELIHVSRSLACTLPCSPICRQSMEVSSPPGKVIGTIQQEWTVFENNFKIKNQTGETVLRIEGPLLTANCCCEDINFNVSWIDYNRYRHIYCHFEREINSISHLFTDCYVGWH